MSIGYFLGKTEVEKAMALPLGEKVGRLLRGTPQLHSGQWLFIPFQIRLMIRTPASSCSLRDVLQKRLRKSDQRRAQTLNFHHPTFFISSNPNFRYKPNPAWLVPTTCRRASCIPRPRARAKLSASRRVAYPCRR